MQRLLNNGGMTKRTQNTQRVLRGGCSGRVVPVGCVPGKSSGVVFLAGGSRGEGRLRESVLYRGRQFFCRGCREGGYVFITLNTHSGRGGVMFGRGRMIFLI